MYFKLSFIFILFLFQSSLISQEFSSDVPTPYINGINILTGKIEQPLSNTYAYEFVEGSDNQKIKKVSSDQQTIEFFYYPNFTEIIENKQRKSIYKYTGDYLITSLEHFTNDLDSWKLYRKEKIHWSSTLPIPSIVSRVLEDGEGNAIISYNCIYNTKGKLSKETLYGNLSGICQTPLLIQENGLPADNDIESYSISYEYALDESDLLLKVSEDNGMFTRYFYDLDSKQCIAKLRGNQNKLLTRYFYEYDDYGCLTKTIVDDGQSYFKNDLTGVTCRKIMSMDSSHQLSSFGQPQLVENKYLDLSKHCEIALDRLTCSYSSDGKLISQQLYDGVGNVLQECDDQNLSKSEVTKVQEITNIDEQSSTTTDTYGNETKCLYDAFGRLIEVQFPMVLDQFDQPYQPRIVQEYNISNQTSKIIDALGNITTMTYTIRGKPASVHYPDGSIESYIYFLDGEIKEKIKRNGNRIVVTRDDLGRIDTKKEFSSSGRLLNEVFYTYAGTLVQSITDGKSFKLYYSYDGAGRQIGCRHETADGIKHASCSYNSNGEAVDIQSWHGSNAQLPSSKKEEKTSQSINKTSDELFTRESICCNNRGQFVKSVESVAKDGTKKINTFDALGRLENTIAFDPFGAKISDQDFRYDANGRKVLEKHSKIYQGKTIGTFLIGWEYDKGDRITAIHEGLGTVLQKDTYYKYNCLGQLLQIIKPDGTTLFYSYNDKDLLSELQTSDGSIAYKYEYDDQQRLVKIYDLLHDTCQYREFDAFNQLSMESDGLSQTHYQYDLLGRCTEIILPDQSGINYHYANNQLFSVERFSKDRLSLYSHKYFYDQETGQLQLSQLIKNVGELHYGYDKSGNLKHIISPWWSEEYSPSSLDENGRLISRTLRDPKSRMNFEYGYNEGQLLNEVGEESNNYTYDSLYNKLTHGSQNWVVNEINQLHSTPNAQFVYDHNGNLIKKIKHDYSINYYYDALSRLTRLEMEQKSAIEYRYDAFNRRIGEQTYLWDEKKEQWNLENTYKFLFDGEKEIGKINQQNEIIELRILGLSKGAEIGAAIAIELQDQIYAPIHDNQGSVRCLIDVKDGKVAEFYRYNSFGEEELFDTESKSISCSLIGNPWHYFSKRVDRHSKLIFFGLRNYDSEMGRWITPDPIFFGDTPNVYAFVKNDPLNHFDLFGLFSISKLWNKTTETVNYFYQTIKSKSNKFKQFINDELRLPKSICESIDKVGRKFIGDSTSLLLGYSSVDSHISYYGYREVSDKVRITFINGILNNEAMLQENLDLISKSHGNVNVHYVFRGTRGWTWDIWRAVLIKTGYYLGYRSEHAYLLAEIWREMINEMGGIDGGGVIIHYAHSLGGSVTDRARTLLTPQEQKMIRVYTIGSATLLNNIGFQSVVNIISANDGVCSFLLEPIGHLRNYFNSNSNVRVYGKFTLSPYGLIPIWPIDHLLVGFTYKPIICQLGQNFLDEFDTL